jgi:hypothetical protein
MRSPEISGVDVLMGIGGEDVLVGMDNGDVLVGVSTGVGVGAVLEQPERRKTINAETIMFFIQFS